MGVRLWRKLSQTERAMARVAKLARAKVEGRLRTVMVTVIPRAAAMVKMDSAALVAMVEVPWGLGGAAVIGAQVVAGEVAVAVAAEVETRRRPCLKQELVGHAKWRTVR